MITHIKDEFNQDAQDAKKVLHTIIQKVEPKLVIVATPWVMNYKRAEFLLSHLKIGHNGSATNQLLTRKVIFKRGVKGWEFGNEVGHAIRYFRNG